MTSVLRKSIFRPDLHMVLYNMLQPLEIRLMQHYNPIEGWPLQEQWEGKSQLAKLVFTLPGKRDSQRHGPILIHRKFLIVWPDDQEFGKSNVGGLVQKRSRKGA